MLPHREPRPAVPAAEAGGAWLTGVFSFGVPALMLGLPFTALTPVVIVGLAAMTLALPWEALIGVMLGVGFLIGPIKILYGGWGAYFIPDAIALLVVLRWAFGQGTAGKPLFGGLAVSTPFCVLLGYLLFEIVNPNAPLLRSAFGLRSWLLYTLMLFVGYAGYHGPRQVERLYRVLMVLGVATAVYGFYQWYAGPSAMAVLGGRYERYARVMGPDFRDYVEGGPVFRAVSTFMSPNMFGINLCFVMLTLFGPLMARDTPRARRVWYAVAIVVMGAVIPVTGSRAPVAYLLGSFVIVLVLFRKYRVLRAVIPLTIVAVYGARVLTQGLLVGRYASMWDPDTYLWKWLNPVLNGFTVAWSNPIGVGLGYAAGQPNFVDDPSLRELGAGTVDSGYGAVTTELGLGGLVIFTWFIVALAVAGYRSWRNLPAGRERELLLAPAIFATALPVWTLLASPHATIPASIYTWLFMGMLLRAGDLAQSRAAARSPWGRIAHLPRPGSRRRV